MAYRFTNTEKWNDAWFCELKPSLKLLFLYLCDQCDIAGFLEINMRKMSFDLGISKQEVEGGLKGLGSRIIFSTDYKFLFVKNFVKHQKNFPLNEKNKAHIGILSRLNENLELFDFKEINDFFKGGYKPLDRGTGIGIGIGIGNGIGNEGGMGETEFETPCVKKNDFLELNLSELKKELKNNAIWQSNICVNNKINPDEFISFIDAYIKKLENEDTRKKTLKDAKVHFSNWLRIQLENGKSTAKNKQTGVSEAYKESILRRLQPD